MFVDSPIGDVDPQIAEATRSVAKTLESLGHTIVEIPTIQASIEEFLPVWRFNIAGLPAVSERVLQPVTRWLRGDGRKITFEMAQAAQAKLVERIHQAFGDADILLSPTVPMVPPLLGALEKTNDPAEWFNRAAQLGAFTAAFNLTTGPAATLPLGLTDNGLPYGIQIGSRLDRDQVVLSLSRQLEEALPWHQRWASGFEPTSSPKT